MSAASYGPRMRSALPAPRARPWSRAAAALLALLSCTSERVVLNVDGADAIFLRASKGGLLEARLFQGAVRFEEDPGASVHVLVYDAPIAHELVIGEGGHLALPGPEDEGWTLPKPARRSDWLGADAVPFDPLAVRVSRPPCPTLATEALRTPLVREGVASLLPLGDGALIGTWAQTQGAQRLVYRAPDGTFSELPGVAWTSTALPAFGYADERGATVWAPLPEDPREGGFFDVAPDLTISGPLRTDYGRARPAWLAGGHFAGRRVVAARFASARAIWALDGGDGTWREVYDSDLHVTNCAEHLRPMVFELRDRDHLVAAVADGRILEFDLRTGAAQAAAELEPPNEICLSGHVVLPSGLELFGHQGGRDQTFVLSWRRGPTGPFAPFYDALLTPTAFASWGALGVIGIESAILLVEDAPAHPEAPPRVCGPYAIESVASHLLDRGDELLVAGVPLLPPGRMPLARVVRSP